jgi:hypothetical protein
MAKVFLPKVVESVYGSKAEPEIRRIALGKVEKKIEEAVMEMKKDLDASKITRELDGGIRADNISETLEGDEAPDNLYSFIGFYAGTDAVAPVRKMLDDPESMGIKARYRGKDYQKGKTQIRYQFTVNEPKISKEALEETKIPWLQGISWLEAIEDFIPGLNKFMAKEGIKGSHSGGGIQMPAALPSRGRSRFKKPKGGYLTGIFKKFIENVQKRTS